MVQGGGGGVEETAVIIADEKRTLKKEASKKTKKVKKGEKENISVVSSVCKGGWRGLGVVVLADVNVSIGIHLRVC